MQSKSSCQFQRVVCCERHVHTAELTDRINLKAVDFSDLLYNAMQYISFVSNCQAFNGDVGTKIFRTRSFSFWRRRPFWFWR
jgi:hypothetical protein